ncbi:hypothetical protein [Leptonema illini]|uniref:Lipoprotein n=1 Tax=Leptonema illini DSM 21528 TaxID=929563 RepID=H2CKL8_9LEPT|nr:hypothetical protein [Leptonema illini]EHQ05073.1 hypothetical protein Lepil_0366 [Leptonema illini DSM 21528]
MRLLTNLLVLSITLSMVSTLVSCVSGYSERIPTGVQRLDAPDGTIRLVATAMASANSIEKDSTAMMQTTSREAARLMLVAELDRPQYARIKDRFEMNEAEFLDRGRYCRMIAVYRPPSTPHGK